MARPTKHPSKISKKRRLFTGLYGCYQAFSKSNFNGVVGAQRPEASEVNEQPETSVQTYDCIGKEIQP